MSLYSPNPKGNKLKGLGYANEEKANDTIRKIKNMNMNYQISAIITMYYRAKHHPHQTKDMRKAMRIFKRWLKNNTSTGFSNN